MDIRKSSASPTNGNRVPNNTTKVAVKSSKLLPNRKLSRDNNLKPALFCNIGALIANNNKEPPATMARKTKIKVPRAGSLEKTCNELSTSERIKQTLIKLNAQYRIPHN